MTQIHLKHLTKQFAGNLLFTADQLTAAPGDRVGIVGSNGVGKTTLARVIAGLDLDFEGQRLVEGTCLLVNQVPPILDQSGGQATMTQLRAALAQQPAILILDEPSANLDDQHQGWLRQQLTHYPGILLVISHDRDLLTQITTRIWSVAHQQVSQVDEPYADFVITQRTAMKQQQVAYARERRQQRTWQAAIQARHEKAARVRRGSKKMGAAERSGTKSMREQNAGKLERGARALADRAERFSTTTKPYQTHGIKLMTTDFPPFTGKTVASADRLTLSRHGKVLLAKARFRLKPRERLALVGPNGVGKSTLLTALMQAQPATHLSTAAKIGYFTQNLAGLPQDQAVASYLQQVSALDQGRTRQLMGAFGLSATFYDRRIGALSGGEQVKVQLLATVLGANNVLILDEPTNFLDLAAIEALQAYLVAYPGTVLFVAHDQAFRQAVATRTLVFKDQQLQDPATMATSSRSAIDISLLQYRYDQLMLDPATDPRELQTLRACIDQAMFD